MAPPKQQDTGRHVVLKFSSEVENALGSFCLNMAIQGF